MRDIFIVTLVACALPYALLHTWFGVLLWTWLSIMNPHKLAFGFAYNAPLAAAAAIVTLLSMVVTRDKLRMAWDPPVLMLIAFLAWMCVTTALAVSPELAWPQLNKVLKIQLMTLIAIAALRERKHIDCFLSVTAVDRLLRCQGWHLDHRDRGWWSSMGPTRWFLRGQQRIGCNANHRHTVDELHKIGHLKEVDQSDDDYRDGTKRRGGTWHPVTRRTIGHSFNGHLAVVSIKSKGHCSSDTY